MSKGIPNESQYSLAFWRGQIRCAGYEVARIVRVSEDSVIWEYCDFEDGIAGTYGQKMETEQLLKEAVSE